MDRLHSLRVFAQVIDEGSFAGAARELNLSPAIVTRLVADLEKHLGARLINRTTRRLVLTDTGELYLERVRQILADIDEADALVSAATSEPSGHLRVRAPPSLATHQLAKHLPEFRALYPRISLELTAAGEAESETVDDRFDVTLLLLRNDPMEGDFVARRLAQSEVVTCAAPSYLARHGRPVHPTDLYEHEALMQSRTREVVFYRSVSREGAQEGESIRMSPKRPALSTFHMDTILSAAIAGMGIAGLPSFMLEEALCSGTLERVLPGWHVGMRTLYVAIPTRKYLPARTRALVDFLLRKFGGTAHDPWLMAADQKP